MKKIFFIAMLALMSGACGEHFIEFDAPLVGYNLTSDPVQAIVNGESVGPIIPSNGSEKFGIKVMIPKKGDIMDLDDRETYITATFRNLRNGKMAEPIRCRAGAKVVTSLTLEIDIHDPSGMDVDCTMLW